MPFGLKKHSHDVPTSDGLTPFWVANSLLDRTLCYMDTVVYVSSLHEHDVKIQK